MVLLSTSGMSTDFAGPLGDSIQDYSHLKMAWEIRYSPLSDSLGFFLWTKETLLGDCALHTLTQSNYI